MQDVVWNHSTWSLKSEYSCSWTQFLEDSKKTKENEGWPHRNKELVNFAWKLGWKVLASEALALDSWNGWGGNTRWLKR